MLFNKTQNKKIAAFKKTTLGEAGQNDRTENEPICIYTYNT